VHPFEPSKSWSLHIEGYVGHALLGGGVGEFKELFSLKSQSNGLEPSKGDKRGLGILGRKGVDWEEDV
jgi:hypothetical protein